MGLIYWWARIASILPEMANFLTQTPILRDGMKLLGGIARQRRMPVFAPQTFTEWFRRRDKCNVGQPRVLLWPDTFNNHFFPEVGRAAVTVLEAAGFQVEIPAKSLCCGRPLYDFGMLGAAKRLLRQILDTLRPEIEAGVPIIGLEPSCIAVFRDEMTNLFPDDEDAKRLRDRSFLISEFFETMLDGYQPPQLKRKAIIHGHCHQKAIVGMAHEKSIFSKLGLDYEILDSGCCGMAGSFGFEAGHYEVSMNVGELVLLPAVRRASKETLIIADGFSCREQIRQGTDREALHTAQVLQLALKQSGVAQTRTNSRNYSPDGSPYPEKTFSQERERERLRAQRQAAFKFGAAASMAVLLWASKRKRVVL
jgi:Fe-S oxidoreductase